MPSQFSLPLDPVVVQSVGQQSGLTVSTVGTLGTPLSITDPSFIQANTALVKANAAFTQANTTAVKTQAVYDYANTISAGAAIDGVARADIVVIKNVNTLQNTSISIIQGVDVTQNAAIAATDGKMSSAYNQANTGTVLAQAAFNSANNVSPQIQPAFDQANTGTVLAQAAFNYANTISSSGTSIDSFARTTANSAINNVSATNGKMESAYTQANTATTNASNASFPAGTALLFQQTAAPTGWTKVTTHNDKALRVVSGTASSGGSVAFSAAFASQAVAGTVGVSGTVGATTLSESQIPSHRHWISGASYDDGNGSTTGSSNSQDYGLWADAGSYSANDPNSAFGRYSLASGGGTSHTHGFSGSGSFTGTAINLAVNYVDVIIATKD